MPRFLDHTRHWNRVYVWGLSYFGDLLLLVVRLYWGSMLVRSGWNRLANLDDTADILKGLGIFWPKINAILSSSAELGCGALMVIGLAARIAAVPLIFNMLVAFATNSGDRFRAIFSAPNDFVTAPEFLYLFACLLILAFGPGVVSLDALIGWFLGRLPAEGAEARDALRSNEIVALNRGRREFAKLVAAAVAGLVAGLLVRRGAGPPAEKEKLAEPSKAASPRAEGTSTSGSANLPAQPAGTDLNLLMVGDPHVCRGLNICKTKGKDHKNACVGQGACATAESHACNGLNDCKGQGGCDGTAGINSCKGKGACAVPLKDETWRLARARFEQLAKGKDLKVGAAPAKS